MDSVTVQFPIPSDMPEDERFILIEQVKSALDEYNFVDYKILDGDKVKVHVNEEAETITGAEYAPTPAKPADNFAAQVDATFQRVYGITREDAGISDEEVEQESENIDPAHTVKAAQEYVLRFGEKYGLDRIDV